MNEPYLILDCNYLCHRAKHVFGDLSYAGSATGVIYGFLRDMLLLRERFHSNNFVFCWDYGDPLRRKLWPTYKERRRAQTQLTKEEEEFEWAFREQMVKLRDEYLPTIGYRRVFFQNGYESDDLIAAFCKLVDDYETAIIVTADQDLYQCIRSNISWFSPRTKEVLNYETFRRMSGIRPTQWALVKAIAGCSSDNIPGISGVGEKRAIQYIAGELKNNSQAHKAIKAGWKTIVLRNRPLVELPFPGVEPLHWQGDDVTQAGWNAVTKVLGMKAIRWRPIA